MTKISRFILSYHKKWRKRADSYFLPVRNGKIFFFCTFCPSEMIKKCRFILSYHQKWQKLIFWAFLPSEITKSYFLPLMNIRKPIFFIFLANCISIWIVWILFRMCYNLKVSKIFCWWGDKVEGFYLVLLVNLLVRWIHDKSRLYGDVSKFCISILVCVYL